MLLEAPEHAVEASLEQDIEGKADIAVADKFEKLEKPAVLQRHDAVAGDKIEVCEE